MASIALLVPMILPPVVGGCAGIIFGSGRFLLEKYNQHEMTTGYFSTSQILLLSAGIIGVISGPILTFVGCAKMWEECNKKNYEGRLGYRTMVTGMAVGFGGSFLLTRYLTIFGGIIFANFLKMLVQ